MEKLMSSAKKSSHGEASKAAKVLRNPSSSGREKKLAGSVLSQARPSAETSPEVAELAAKVLENPNASRDARSLAGSALSQAEHLPYRLRR
jgi:hypothetical protein